MVFSSSQQVVVAFTAVLFAFVVFPRMFGVGSGAKETRGFDARYNRKGSMNFKIVFELAMGLHRHIV